MKYKGENKQTKMHGAGLQHDDDDDDDDGINHLKVPKKVFMVYTR